MADSFFVDGYTRPGKVAARKGLHPELTFDFRPALPEERMALNHPSMTPDAYAARALDLVAKRVVKWNAPGKPDRDSVARLEPSLFRDVLDFVLGYGVVEAEADEKNSPGA